MFCFSHANHASTNLKTRQVFVYPFPRQLKLGKSVKIMLCQCFSLKLTFKAWKVRILESIFFAKQELITREIERAISWTAHVRAEAQNLKNSAEFFKIDPAEKWWRLQVAEAAMAVNEGTRVAKKTISDLKQCKREWFKNLQRTFLEIIYFSRGLQRNSRQDVNVLVTAISRHVRHLLNIGEGKSCFSLPDDLTVKDYFVNESYLWHLHEDRQKTKVKQRCDDAYYVWVICFVLVSIVVVVFFFRLNVDYR